MQEEGILARQLARRYLAASEHDQGSTLWMQSNIMDHMWHHEISAAKFWEEVGKQRRLAKEITDQDIAESNFDSPPCER